MSAPHESGPLSVYRPNDGYNHGKLACGGQYTENQVHIAHRRWRQLGCGRKVWVYSKQTKRYIEAIVSDAGPFGIVNNKGHWKTWTKSYKPPKGWRYRGMVDLSWALWKKLGRPEFLSTAHLYFAPEIRRKFIRETDNRIVTLTDFVRGAALESSLFSVEGRARPILRWQSAQRSYLTAGGHGVEALLSESL